jgi:hypothetical protein
VVPLGLIALFAVLETGVNAFFYENAQGLLGGAVVALSISAINMLGAMGLGLFFRYKNLTALDKKILGWGCLALFVFLTIYSNALFAAFRSEYQLVADPSNPMEVRRAFASALVQAKQAIFFRMKLADVMSFVLFIIGILLSSFAFYKGYTLDDRFPGYGTKDRALKKAQGEENDRQDQLRSKTKEFLQKRRSEIQTALHDHAQLVGRIAARSGDLKHACSMLTTQAQAIQRDFELVLRGYRAANMAIRATESPAYFKDFPGLASRHATDAAGLSLLDQLKLAQDSIQQLRAKHEGPLNAMLQKHQEDSATILTKSFTEFLRAVDLEAEEQINRETPLPYRAARLGT